MSCTILNNTIILVEIVPIRIQSFAGQTAKESDISHQWKEVTTFQTVVSKDKPKKENLLTEFDQHLW